MSVIKITEQASLYDDLEKKTISELLYAINAEDQKVALAVQKVIPQIEQLVSETVSRMKQGGRLFYIGAGTSGRLGVLDASEIPPTFGMPPSLVIGIIAGGDKALRNPVEGAEDDAQAGWNDLLKHQINDKDTLVGIAASGSTPYVAGALHEARKNGILTASIAGNPDSPLSREADIAIEIIVGPEFITGSSRMKSGTGQKMVLNMISTSIMIQLGRVKGNRMINMQLSNAKLIDRGARMIAAELGLEYEEAKRLLLLHKSVKKVISPPTPRRGDSEASPAGRFGEAEAKLERK
ncbi:N-acetylmuramic acid 6-phosphate etherase [Viscerimonas tarda]